MTAFHFERPAKAKENGQERKGVPLKRIVQDNSTDLGGSVAVAHTPAHLPVPFNFTLTITKMTKLYGNVGRNIISRYQGFRPTKFYHTVWSCW